MADSFGIGLIADRQPRPRTQERARSAPETKGAAEAAHAVEAERIERAGSTNPMTGFDEQLPDGMLFTVALLANTAPRPVQMEEVILRQSHDWLPPTSDLHLADKKI